MSTIDAKTLALAGLVVATPTLLGLRGVARHAGAANKAAAASLRASAYALAVPESASMMDAYELFVKAVEADPSMLSLGRARAVWLDAFAAGAAASPRDYSLTGTLAEGDLLNVAPMTDVDTLCGFFDEGLMSPLGRAVCALADANLSDGRDALMSRVRAVAVAMDDADYVSAGNRRSEREYGTPLSSLPGKLVGVVAGFVGDAAWELLKSPAGLVIVGGAAFVAWKVLT